MRVRYVGLIASFLHGATTMYLFIYILNSCKTEVKGKPKGYVRPEVHGFFFSIAFHIVSFIELMNLNSLYGTVNNYVGTRRYHICMECFSLAFIVLGIVPLSKANQLGGAMFSDLHSLIGLAAVVTFILSAISSIAFTRSGPHVANAHIFLGSASIMLSTAAFALGAINSSGVPIKKFGIMTLYCDLAFLAFITTAIVITSWCLYLQCK